MTTPSISTSSSPNWQQIVRPLTGLIIAGVTLIAARSFLALEHNGATRWLIICMCVIALLEAALGRRYLLAISTTAVITSYWALYAVASGSLPVAYAAIGYALFCSIVVWQSSLLHQRSDGVVLIAIAAASFVTSSYIPSSIIVSTAVAIIPFVLLLPLVLTKERCTATQYGIMLGLLLIAAICMTSSAILFT